jgi:hypothetical protein
LVPREYSSGEQQQRGRVMRSAHPYVQALLVQAAWRVCRSTDPRTSALREWPRPLRRVAGRTSPSWHWPGDSPAFSMRCGGMKSNTNRLARDRVAARPLVTRVDQRRRT